MEKAIGKLAKKWVQRLVGEVDRKVGQKSNTKVGGKRSVKLGRKAGRELNVKANEKKLEGK